MSTNVIKITGQSGTGKSAIAHFFRQILQASGYTVAVVDGQRLDAQDECDFIFWTMTTKSRQPQITFTDWNGLNDFKSALCRVKKRGSIGKVESEGTNEPNDINALRDNAGNGPRHDADGTAPGPDTPGAA